MLESLLGSCIVLFFISIFFIVKFIIQKKEIESLQGNLEELKEECLVLKEINTNTERENAILQTKLDNSEESLKEKIDLLSSNKHTLLKEFKVLASEVFENNSKKFSEQNSINLAQTLTPLKEQMSEFKKKIEDVYISESKERTILNEQIKTLKELNIQISEDAINLTNALKGESKTQGIWGEMILQKVLESSGLRLGSEYNLEVTLNSNDNERFRPDAIVNLPNERNVIIDAKTSLRAYERYISADEESKHEFLKEHIHAIQNHIKALSNKEYEKLQGINSLDFIFMFIPIEGALILAMKNDISLFDEAFKKKIVLVTPTTLLVGLKAIENSWRYERQAKNLSVMVNRAEMLYSKFYGFIEDLKDVGKAIDNADKKYNDAFKKLSEGKGNILRQIQMFKDEANINPKKEIDI